MVESKYLVEQVMTDNVGSVMEMRIETVLESDGNWKILGDCTYSVTMDGEHWGKMNISAMAYDSAVSNGIATVMYSIMQTVGDDEFLDELAIAIEEAELGEEK